jgi:hypothetical protein
MRLWRRRAQGGEQQQARHARRDAERRLRETRRQWPQVNQARDQLAAIVEQALRGGRS